MNLGESNSRISGGFFLHGWRVDPSGSGQLVRLRHTVFETVWRALEGDRQRGLALLAHFGCAAGVDALRRHHGDAGMPVLLVVPSGEDGAMLASVGERAKAHREAGLILQSFEMRLQVWVVVRDIRPAVRLDDAKIRWRPFRIDPGAKESLTRHDGFRTTTSAGLTSIA
jgi:hypothetical protein